MQDISLIIPTYQRPAALLRCLQALEQQTLSLERFEVIVIDDGSNDNTLDQLESWMRHSPLTLRIESQPNQGPAAARNRGITLATGAWLAFTDDDCVPLPDWLEKLWEALPAASSCAGLSGKTVKLEDHVFGRFIDRVGSLQPGRNPEGEITYVVTCNALLRKAAVEEVDGFDQRVAWAGGEEPILGGALRAAGYFFVSAPEAMVAHQHPASVGTLFRMYARYGRGEKIGSLLQVRRGYSGNLLYFIKMFLLDNWQLLGDRHLPWTDRLRFCLLTSVKALGNVWGWWHQSTDIPKPVSAPQLVVPPSVHPNSSS